jgi:hypothetical protein
MTKTNTSKRIIFTKGKLDHGLRNFSEYLFWLAHPSDCMRYDMKANKVLQIVKCKTGFW